MGAFSQGSLHCKKELQEGSLTEHGFGEALEKKCRGVALYSRGSNCSVDIIDSLRASVSRAEGSVAERGKITNHREILSFQFVKIWFFERAKTFTKDDGSSVSISAFPLISRS